MKLSEMCLLNISVVETACLFVITTALGYVLVVSALSGEFV